MQYPDGQLHLKYGQNKFRRAYKNQEGGKSEAASGSESSVKDKAWETEPDENSLKFIENINI